MAYAYKDASGQWVEFVGSTLIDDVQYPANWPDIVSPQMRTSRGIRPIVEPGSVDPAYRITGSRIVDNDGPVREWLTAAIGLSEAKATRKALARDNAAIKIAAAIDAGGGVAVVMTTVGPIVTGLISTKAAIENATTVAAVNAIPVGG